MLGRDTKMANFIELCHPVCTLCQQQQTLDRQSVSEVTCALENHHQQFDWHIRVGGGGGEDVGADRKETKTTMWVTRFQIVLFAVGIANILTLPC